MRMAAAVVLVLSKRAMVEARTSFACITSNRIGRSDRNKMERVAKARAAREQGAEDPKLTPTSDVHPSPVFLNRISRRQKTPALEQHISA